MVVAATAPKVTTAQELLQMQGGLQRFELLRGELRPMSPAGARHGRLAWIVGGLLFAHVGQTGSGVAFGAETGFLLSRDPDTVRAPDAAFVSKKRFEAIGDTEKFWPGAPDLAVEVLSPDDSFHHVQEKALAWIEAGAIAVLVVDPRERSATVYRAGGDAHVHRHHETIDLSDAVSGFSLSLSALFG